MKKFIPFLLLSVLCGCSSPQDEDIVIDNPVFTLTIDKDACAKSLVIKENGKQVLVRNSKYPLFSVTQPRPYNNETKLQYPNTETTYESNRIRRSGDTLFVGFDKAPYEAVITLTEGRGYVTFTLDGFICDCDKVYHGLIMDLPRVESFRLLQLPVKEKDNFGQWLNVMWDDNGAVCVCGCDPYALIWHKDIKSGRVLTADLLSSNKIVGGRAAIVAGVSKDGFLESMDNFEADSGLPRGVQSRRSPLLNRSCYWVRDANPGNIDRHIEYAKKAGFEMMLFYYACFVKNDRYAYLGDYDFLDCYPGGYDDLRAMIERVKAAGIHPGLHVLQTHIGIQSRYVTPSVDSRLGKLRYLTLKSPVPASGDVDEIRVAENPEGSPMVDGCRVLTFGGEAFSYEGYSIEPPYRYTGVKRSHYNTVAVAHKAGEIGGILDVSEYGARSIYIDQNTDLQDEIADKVARIYNCGFEFAYFDGSEGVGAPCGINVALSQHRMISKFETDPIYTEGAAKSHFSWHSQAGANAFDVFKPHEFKEKIVEFPYSEAHKMKMDMTRVDFGWWRLFPETTPDMWNFADSLAAESGCPVTIQMDLATLDNHPRTEELLSILRKWEAWRKRN